MSVKHKKLVKEYFADTFMDVEEPLKSGELSCDEVVNAFAEALTEAHQYFQDTADIYEKLINAVISRYRNK
jgi:hypothetical protein